MLDKVIRDIVEIDLDCSNQVEQAKQKRQDLQMNMSEMKKAIYDSFVKEYQDKVDEHKKHLEQTILETKQRNDQEYRESLNQLSDLCEKNKDEWVLSIVSRSKEI